MLIVRFRITCQPGKAEQALEVMRPVVAPSRELDGVVHFDIARDIVDADSIIATEIFDDMAALDRQNALPEVAAVMAALPGLLAAEPEATLFRVSSAEPID